jgi:hypothetical protein
MTALEAERPQALISRSRRGTDPFIANSISFDIVPLRHGLLLAVKARIRKKTFRTQEA